MKLITAVSLLYSTLRLSNAAFVTHSQQCKTSSSSSLYAIGVLARKAKENDLRKMLEAGEIAEDVIAKVKEIKSVGVPDSDDSFVPGPLQTTLTRRKGTITIIAEYKRKFDDNAAFISDVLDPDILSTTFREGGASAVAVMADKRIGGCTYSDLATIYKEQETARGDVPGPLPVISSDLIVDELQIAQSAIAGAAAVAITYGVVGEERLKGLLADCKAANLECVVNVLSKEECEAAVAAGARLICVSGIEGVDSKVAVFDGVTAPNDEPICKIAAVLARDNKQLEEVEEVWMLRDKGFQAVWVSDALYKSGNDPLEHPGAIIKSMKAKSSVKYASARVKTGKGEGAREYLGDIMM